MDKVVQTASELGFLESLVNYGALGVMAIAMATALWFLLKRVLKAEDDLKEKVDNLQKEMNEYIRDDQSKMREVIEHNSRAMSELREVIIRSKYEN